jgi:hypothetical protein
MIDEDDCGAIGVMKMGRGNRSTRRKPAPVPLCPPQIPHDQTRARTPGRRGGKPATNRLSYVTTLLVPLPLDKHVRENWGTPPRILNPGAIFSFTSRSLYPRQAGRSPEQA